MVQKIRYICREKMQDDPFLFCLLKSALPIPTEEASGKKAGVRSLGWGEGLFSQLNFFNIL